jgi:hypothetical protein
MCPVEDMTAAAEISGEHAFSENTAKNRKTPLAAICSDRRALQICSRTPRLDPDQDANSCSTIILETL